MTEQTNEVRSSAHSVSADDDTARDVLDENISSEETTETGDHRQTMTSTEEEPETFPREYVVNLRDEAAKYRTRAQRADDLAARLHTSLVAATGRLADPTDLPFEESHLDEEEALTAAIDDLLARKPHLASRKPSGDVGQGATGDTTAVDLAGMLRARA
jgi:hypothetical protein